RRHGRRALPGAPPREPDPALHAALRRGRPPAGARARRPGATGRCRAARAGHRAALAGDVARPPRRGVRRGAAGAPRRAAPSARAELLEGEIALHFAPAHAHDGTAEFGTVTGSVALGDVRHPVTARGFAEDGASAGPWPRLRAALDLGDGASLALTLGLHGGEANGFLCRDGRHVAVAAAHATLGPADAPLARVGLELELADGRRLRIAARARPPLPLI